MVVVPVGGALDDVTEIEDFGDVEVVEDFATVVVVANCVGRVDVVVLVVVVTEVVVGAAAKVSVAITEVAWL